MSATFGGVRGDGLCHCGGSLPYAACCRPLHLGQSAADTPERLMRSRYAAFAVGEVPYLRRTWHPSTRPRRLALDPSLVWTGLAVTRAVTAGEEGVVEFTAHFRAGTQVGSMHELSRFVRKDGDWLYVEAMDPASGFPGQDS